MGIAIGDLLTMDFFKEFEVIAGRRGLHKEIQGFAVFEAPDCYKWAVGKELIFSSGYVISKEPDSIEKAFEAQGFDKTSGFIIKRGRFLNEIPQHIIELFEKHNIPLITMPFSMSWMELMNEVNIAVMNQTIKRFSIVNREMPVHNLSYKEQKIQHILQAVEMEMDFPAFLYDVTEKKSYYSSPNFRRITEKYGLQEEDYWMPSKPYTQHSLCDYISMSRYRLLNQGNVDGPRVSWVLIPITMGGITYAYFVVMESREFLDFYDEYSIRIAYLMLQGVYEQIMIAWDMGNVGFENFVHLLMNDTGEDQQKLIYQASTQEIDMNMQYNCILFHQCNQKCNAQAERKSFINSLRKSSVAKSSRLAFLDKNEGVIFLETVKEYEREEIYTIIKEYELLLSKECKDAKLQFGVCRDVETLLNIRQSVQKCRKALEMGRILYPNNHIWYYDMLGILAWIQVPDVALKDLLAKYQELTKEQKNVELLKTLKIYLENNMNYSVTADRMYLNINTIRKRIDKINSILKIDWNNHVQRLEVELLLQFLNLS